MEIETERTAAAAPAGDGSSMWMPALSLKCPSPQSYVHCAHKPLRIRTKMWRTFSTCSICSQRPAQECWLISSASWTRCAIVPRLVCIAVKGNFLWELSGVLWIEHLLSSHQHSPNGKHTAFFFVQFSFVQIRDDCCWTEKKAYKSESRCYIHCLR